MNNLLVVGMILFFGFIMGEIASITKLPKVTGYIIGGIILNPQLTHIIPDNFISNADIATNMALAFITFSVGGTLLSSKIKKLGKSILLITLFEAEFALLAVVLGFVAIFYIYPVLLTAATISLSVPLAILMGVLASPTDPSATLAGPRRSLPLHSADIREYRRDEGWRDTQPWEPKERSCQGPPRSRESNRQRAWIARKRWAPAKTGGVGSVGWYWPILPPRLSNGRRCRCRR